MRLTRYHGVLIATGLLTALTWLCAAGWVRLVVLGFLLTLAGLLIGLGVSFPQWQFFGEVLCRVQTRRQAVALTFDDGPDPATTPALLDLLAQLRVQATFFWVGERVARHPDLVRRATAEGHQVENHSQRHRWWANLYSAPRLQTELAQAQEQIQRLTGRAPAFFRPPMGLTNPRVFRVARHLGLRVTGYTVRGLDRRKQRPATIVRRLARRFQPGAILLLHDGAVPRERLTAVTRLLIDRLRCEGYCCLRLDRLVAAENAI
jgi:peptidoglycan-N-acetylglucosamine deacetylase